MSVVKCADKYGTGQGSADYEWKNTFTRELRVWVDDVDDGPAIVLESNLVPKVGDTYASGNDSDPGSWCKDVQIVRHDEVEKTFDVDCQYDNDKPETEPNPLLRPALLHWSTRREEFFFPHDTRGNYYVTPAGVPMENPPPTPISLMILTISKNVASYDPVAMALFKDAVNTAPWLGFAAGAAKVEDIEPGELVHEGLLNYYPMVTTVAFRTIIPWHPDLHVAKGRHHKIDGGEVMPTDAAGGMTDQETFLAEDGSKTDAAEPFLMKFYPFPEKHYDGLAQFTGLAVPW